MRWRKANLTRNHYHLGMARNFAGYVLEEYKQTGEVGYWEVVPLEDDSTKTLLFVRSSSAEIVIEELIIGQPPDGTVLQPDDSNTLPPY